MIQLTLEDMPSTLTLHSITLKMLVKRRYAKENMLRAHEMNLAWEKANLSLLKAESDTDGVWLFHQVMLDSKQKMRERIHPQFTIWIDNFASQIIHSSPCLWSACIN